MRPHVRMCSIVLFRAAAHIKQQDHGKNNIIQIILLFREYRVVLENLVKKAAEE